MKQLLDPEDESEVVSLAKSEFVSGYNINIFEFTEFIRVVLPLLKEEGRKIFLEEIGRQLDEFSDIQHRKSWAELLKTV